eukprot:11156129-Lingulodinium_polyedra.AAC.1
MDANRQFQLATNANIACLQGAPKDGFIATKFQAQTKFAVSRQSQRFSTDSELQGHLRFDQDFRA